MDLIGFAVRAVAAAVVVADLHGGLKRIQVKGMMTQRVEILKKLFTFSFEENKENFLHEPSPASNGLTF